MNTKSLLFLFCSAVFARANTAVVISAGYSMPVQIPVAPGQIITFFVSGIGDSLTESVVAAPGALSASLAGISATLQQTTRPVTAPLLEVRPVSTCSPLPPQPCGTFAAVTVQIPFELVEEVPGSFSIPVPATLSIAENGSPVALVRLKPTVDNIHVIKACDLLPVSTALRAAGRCNPSVTHADGSVVSASNPAKGGEELVLYAFGLGKTVNAVATGEPSPTPASASFTHALDFAFRVDALPTQPRPLAPDSPASTPTSVFAGLSPGSIGLYQVNFVVPPVPAGLPPCDNPNTLYSVQSNLTVSIGALLSKIPAN
jgi:uncharacterized protein (TIGR03437 family)